MRVGHRINMSGRKITKIIFIAIIACSPLLFGSLIFVDEFSPLSLDVKWFVNPLEIDVDDLKLKNVVSIEMIGSPKMGVNTLKVSWPVWSDCSPPYLEVIQYNIFSKEITIWIWGNKWNLCIQVVAFNDYVIELFIPYSGYWKISCNNTSMNITI